MADERCRWCRRIFVSDRAASIHEQRCRLKAGEKPAFECRLCGVRLARHFGRARRMAHEQYCLGSAVANLTCRGCGELFVHMQARRLHERFCARMCPEADGEVYWARASLSQRSLYCAAQTICSQQELQGRGGGATEINVFVVRSCLPLGREKLMSLRVGFVGGVIGCSAPRPIVHCTNGAVLIGHRPR